MLTWLYNLLIGNLCKHKWVIIKRGSLIGSNGKCRGTYYDQQCDHCGKITTTNCD